MSIIRKLLPSKQKHCNELVIRYGEYYFGIMLDPDTGEPTGKFGWSLDPGVFPDTPVREFYVAERIGLDKEQAE